MIYRFFYIAAFILFFSHVSAQRITTFPTGSNEFYEAFVSFMEDQERRDDRRQARELIETFTPYWDNYNSEKKNLIIANANRMLGRRLRPFPHFSTYLYTLMNFEKAGLPDDNFVILHEVFEEVIDQARGRHYFAFLEFCKHLFLDNSLYVSPSTRWVAEDAVYVFRKDDNQPYLEIKSFMLKGYANNDSTVIYNTQGNFYPLDNTWKGSGGLISWERAGFERDVVWAELPDYEINLRFSRYDIDSVLFYNKNFFDEPLLGQLSERVLANVTPQDASYPRFNSYDLRLRIDNVFEDVNYEGGFSMRGYRLIGSGDKDTDAILTFKREDNDFVVFGAQSYSITENNISANNARVTIYMEEDSIFHPSIRLRYTNANREVSLIRDMEGISASPFFNSFHELDMYFEALYWKMDEPKMDIRMIRGLGSEGAALFESNNYFSEYRFDRIQGIDEVSPLTLLRNYSRQIYSREFHLTEIAGHMRLSHNQTKVMLINLARQGFIWYDLNYDRVVVKDKLIHYINAKAERTDYDVIQFHSVVSEGSNARINLLNYDLNLRGVERVFLSDSHNVVIYPHEQLIKVQKNRDFAFDGRINAGLFEYIGKRFTFEYEAFKINMPIIDSLTFRVIDRRAERDAYGRFPMVRIRSVIEDAGGELLIDHHSNKSGLLPYHQYPIFNSKKDAYVYYDRSFIHDGVYKRDHFYFHLKPFTIDSLNTFSTEGLAFEGYLSSANIFPDIQEPLRVQPDFSLGFVKPTPANGYPAYGGKGTFFNTVNLSNRGLVGQGALEYLTSVSESDRFYFFPDSMSAVAQSFVVNEQLDVVEYPDLKSENVAQLWLPYMDELNVSHKTTPLKMYQGESQLYGSAKLTPSQLTGNGMMEFNDAEMESELYVFRNRVFDADTADFRLKTYDLTQYAFATYNYKSFIDFDERVGNFESNGGISQVEFPLNLYMCYMDRFDWFMDDEEIEVSLKAGEQIAGLDTLSIGEIADADIPGSEFISLHPQQDSLRFIAPSAKYNLRENVIYAQNVKVIKVADAAIFPGDGLVTVFKDALMDTLKDAQILANLDSRHHTIYNAEAFISSRNKYIASGQYDYIDETESKQLIYFHEISVNDALQSYAKGTIAKELAFTLSPHFDFSGDVMLTADNQFLEFNGLVRIDMPCDTNRRYWTKFKADINPLDIFIPLSDEIYDENDIRLHVGLMQSQDSIYSAFLTPKLRPNDHELLTASGYLHFNSERREYIVSSKEKIRDFSLTGNLYRLHRDQCFTFGEGKINLSETLGQLTFDVYGNVEHNIYTGAASIDGMALLDFYFNDDALQMIINNIQKYTNLPPVDITRETYTKALTEIVGADAAEQMTTDLGLVGRIRGRFPAELQKTFVLSHLRLNWHPTTNSFKSDGKIGIGNMQGNIINNYVDGYLELVQRRGGDRLFMYLELASDDWFFFGYQNRVMQGFSSHREFITAITEERPQDRRMRTERGEEPYSYNISSQRRVERFIEDFLELRDD